MNTVIETLFLRRPRIEYVSPPICDALFSSSGTPSIILDPFEKHLGPTGPVGGGKGRRYFRWPNYPGALCFTLYRSDVAEGIYSIVSECIPPDVFALCTAGTYYVTVNTSEGESAPGDSLVVTGGSYSFLALPQYPGTLCYNLYKDGEKVWSCVAGGGFQICHDGCYKVSAITPEGETPLSEAVCPDYNCPDVVCEGNYEVDLDTCECVCVEQACPGGYHWDAGACDCVVTPVGPCSSFVDILPTTFTPMAVSAGGLVTGNEWNNNETFRYIARVCSAPFPIDGGSVSGEFIDSLGNVYGTGYGAGSQDWKFSIGDAFETIDAGPGAPDHDNFKGVSEAGLVAYIHSPSGSPNTIKIWKDGAVIATLDDGASNVYINYLSVGPAGHVLWETFASHLYVWSEGAGSVDTGFTSAHGVQMQALNVSGQVAFASRETGTNRNDFYFWNGVAVVLIKETTNGGLIFGVNDSGVVVGLESSAPYNGTPGTLFRWSEGGGFESLGMPVGGTDCYYANISNDGVIAGEFNNGMHVYVGGGWIAAASMALFADAGWTSVDYTAMSRDGYVIGTGTNTGDFFGFVAHLCPVV